MVGAEVVDMGSLSRRRTAFEGERAGQHCLARGALDRQRPTMPGRSRQTRARRVELVMESLLGDLAVTDQTTAVPHSSAQRIDRRLLRSSPGPRPCGAQIRQRSTVAVIGREPTRAELRP